MPARAAVNRGAPGRRPHSCRRHARSPGGAGHPGGLPVPTSTTSSSRWRRRLSIVTAFGDTDTIGIFRSANYGGSWTTVTHPSKDVTDVLQFRLAVHPPIRRRCILRTRVWKSMTRPAQEANEPHGTRHSRRPARAADSSDRCASGRERRRLVWYSRTPAAWAPQPRAANQSVLFARQHPSETIIGRCAAHYLRGVGMEPGGIRRRLLRGKRSTRPTALQSATSSMM